MSDIEYHESIEDIKGAGVAVTVEVPEYDVMKGKFYPAQSIVFYPGESEWGIIEGVLYIGTPENEVAAYPQMEFKAVNKLAPKSDPTARGKAKGVRVTDVGKGIDDFHHGATHFDHELRYVSVYRGDVKVAAYPSGVDSVTLVQS